MNPLGRYGNIVAAILAVVIVVAAIAAHLLRLMPDTTWLDNAALLALGVVFGTQVVQNGTQTAAKSALAETESLRARVNALEAVAAPNTLAQAPALPNALTGTPPA